MISGQIQFFVTYTNNKTSVLNLDSCTKVEDLFCKISNHSRTPINNFYLLCDGKIILDQTKTLSRSGIKNNSTIVMLTKNNVYYKKDSANYEAYLEHCKS